MRVALRPATEEDFRFLWSLHQATMKTYVEETWGEWDQEWQRAYFIDRFAPERIQVAEKNGRPVGCIDLFHDSEGSLFLSALEVAPAHQREGIGTQLVEYALRQASQKDLTARLRVLKVNPAKQLYERLGFEQTGETATHYLMGQKVEPVENSLKNERF